MRRINIIRMKDIIILENNKEKQVFSRNLANKTAFTKKAQALSLVELGFRHK